MKNNLDAEIHVTEVGARLKSEADIHFTEAVVRFHANADQLDGCSQPISERFCGQELINWDRCFQWKCDFLSFIEEFHAPPADATTGSGDARFVHDLSYSYLYYDTIWIL